MIGYWSNGEPPECNEREEDDTPQPALKLDRVGYDFDPLNGTWDKLLSTHERVAGRDHKDGRVLRGQRYTEVVVCVVDDDTRKSWIERRKVLR